MMNSGSVSTKLRLCTLPPWSPCSRRSRPKRSRAWLEPHQKPGGQHRHGQQPPATANRLSVPREPWHGLYHAATANPSQQNRRSQPSPSAQTARSPPPPGRRGQKQRRLELRTLRLVSGLQRPSRKRPHDLPQRRGPPAATAPPARPARSAPCSRRARTSTAWPRFPSPVRGTRRAWRSV